MVKVHQSLRGRVRYPDAHLPSVVKQVYLLEEAHSLDLPVKQERADEEAESITGH